MLSRKYFCLAAGLVWSGRLCAAEGEAPAPSAEDTLVRSVAHSSAAFAADLCVQMRGRPESVAFAPVGLLQALLPVAAGVEGGARGEFARTLHLGVGLPEAADGLVALTAELQAAAGGAGELEFARALWVRDSIALNPSYVDFLWQRCRSELRSGAFRDPDTAARGMNRWIADRTGGRIRMVSEAREIGADSSLIVAAAVDFRAEWAGAFDPAATASGDFWPPPPVRPPAASGEAAGGAPGAVPAPEGATPEATTPPAEVPAVVVPMMRRIAPLRLASRPGFRLVELPFRGGRLAFVVLLPADGNSLDQVEAEVTAERMVEWLRAVQGAETRQVDLRLPRFRIAPSVLHIEPLLRGAGISAVFDRNGAADFSIAGEDLSGAALSLAAVHHVVRFEVAEAGVGGAAVSAVPAGPGAYDTPVEPPVAFTVNRPFLFWVTDRETGGVLFGGRVVDPRTE